MRENHEQWMKLAELASKEEDAGRLLFLVTEVNRLLEEKQRRLESGPSKA